MQVSTADPDLNRRVVLAARPRGEPVPSDFRIEEEPIRDLEQGEILLQTLYLSLDPIRTCGDSWTPNPTTPTTPLPFPSAASCPAAP
ncbi:MAG: hypothetical protein R3223_11295 [Longimicrobiales bacterium]|nr:hypothetical protein [Longimicrobiales bacterium]